MQYFEAQRSDGGTLIVVDPRAHADGAGGDAASAAHAGHRRRARQRAAAHRRSATAPDRPGLHPPAHRRVRAASARVVAAYWPERVERITGVPEAAARAAPPACSATAKPPMVLTARGAEQQAQGVEQRARLHQPRARARARRDSRFAATAASPARATARAAASTGRRRTSCPAIAGSTIRRRRAHIAAVWGIARRQISRAGTSAYELLDRLGRDGGVRALFVMGSNLAVSAPRAQSHREAAATRSTCSSSPTSSSPRPRRSPTWCCRPRSGPRKKAR